MAIIAFLFLLCLLSSTNYGFVLLPGGGDLKGSTTSTTNSRKPTVFAMTQGANTVTTNGTSTNIISNGTMAPGCYRMVALDMDGTLLQSNHKVSDSTRDYLQSLNRRGFTVILATGRAEETIYETIRTLNFPGPLYVVCSNGARGIVCSLQKSEASNVNSDEQSTTIVSDELFSLSVPEAVVRKAISLASKRGNVVQYYASSGIYANPVSEAHFKLTDLYRELTGSKTQYVKDNFAELLQRELPSKMLVLCPVEEQDDMIDAFKTAFDDDGLKVDGKSPTLVRGNLGWFMEILHPHVNKGVGLKTICEKHLHIPLHEVVAFGDGDNDYEFIQIAGRGVVMKNGRPVVKEVADEITDFTNDEDGVMKALQTLEQEGRLIFNA